MGRILDRFNSDLLTQRVNKMQYQRRKTDKITCISPTTFSIEGMTVDEFIDDYKDRFRIAYQKGGILAAYDELKKSATTGRIEGFGSREIELAENFKVTPYFIIHDDFGNVGKIDLST